MEVNVYNIKGEDTGRKITLNESIFGIEPNDHAIYLDVKQFMANQRQGTHKSKERSEISGTDQRTDEADLGTDACPQRASGFKVDDGTTSSFAVILPETSSRTKKNPQRRLTVRLP